MNHPAYTHSVTNRTSQRGLSLVELMISITIGLLILSALATLFVNQSNTRMELDKSNRLIDNGRYAVEVLSENLRLAGFYGEGELTVAPVILDPCTSNLSTPNLSDLRSALGLYVAGYNAASSSTTIGSLPCGLVTADLKAGSDILVLRRADTAPIAIASAIPGMHYIQLSNCKNNTESVTSASSVIDTTAANYILHQRDCVSGANVRRFVVQTYFISPNNIAGDGIPTLKVIEFDQNFTGISTIHECVNHATPASPTLNCFVITPLVEGIEYLQVEYGVDGDNDGVADSYVTNCATAVCWSNVVSVKLNVIARNTEPTTGYINNNTYALGLAGSFGPFSDNYKRHVYTQVVRLVNPSSRRETP
jgi:type IV pilus assembly protein PilW